MRLDKGEEGDETSVVKRMRLRKGVRPEVRACQQQEKREALGNAVMPPAEKTDSGVSLATWRCLLWALPPLYEVADPAECYNSTGGCTLQRKSSTGER